ncbi:glycosyltransferase [Haloarcula brevis]|uniref:glycosyltransferase n=1 Tax=Haloarcula brevis TaxID=3111453 RepID=UPI00387EE23C
MALGPDGSPVDKREVEPSVSIVLPTFNESDIVETKLEDIASLDYPTEKLELVVVDASDDGTGELIESFYTDQNGPTLSVIREDSRRGLAVALNDGYAAASNEIVVKTDCDSKLAPDALREAVANFDDPSVGGVTGRNADVIGGSEVESNYRGMQAFVQMAESHLDSTLIFHGPFSAFRRNLIVPIDEDSLADDSELALRIRRNGSRVVFDPAVRYKEAAQSAFRDRRAQKDRRGMGLLRLLFRQVDALGQHGAYGRVVLPLNWGMMVISPWLVTAGIIAIVAGAISNFGWLGIAVPLTLGGFVLLGSADRLGPFEPLYALFDAQVSLVSAGLSLVLSDADGTWDQQTELRNTFQTGED